MEEMHKTLIQLLQSCLDELKSQIKKFEGLSGSVEECLTVEKALLKSFFMHIRIALGKSFVYIGAKAKSLLRNIGEINRMIWLLLNMDCIVFYNYLTDLRTGDLHENFSIFKYCDEGTNLLIDKLTTLAKERIFHLERRDQKTPANTGEENKGKKVSKDRKSFLEKEYGRLLEGYNKRWLWFAERATHKVEGLKQF